MKKLKILFHALYFSYLVISVLMFVFKQTLYDQSQDLGFLLRFLNFWILLGFFFFISMWIIQVIHIRMLKKDMEDMESELFKVKSKLYDVGRVTEKPQAPPTDSSAEKTTPQVDKTSGSS